MPRAPGLQGNGRVEAERMRMCASPSACISIASVQMVRQWKMGE